jgi:hypothetical protein
MWIYSGTFSLISRKKNRVDHPGGPERLRRIRKFFFEIPFLRLYQITAIDMSDQANRMPRMIFTVLSKSIMVCCGC